MGTVVTGELTSGPKLPEAPQLLPDLDAPLRLFATAWAKSPLRPIPSAASAARWDAFARKWADDPSPPLLVRRARGNRGTLVRHDSGRGLVPVDNSPATWAFASSLLGSPPPDDLLHALRSGLIPVAMVLAQTERASASFQGCLRSSHNLNQAGWKVAHLDPVALPYARSLQSLPIDLLRSHHVRLLSPTNMFLIPKLLGGLAELPVVIDAVRASDAT